MKINLKKISERVNYWLGIIAIGLIVGFSLQFVKAWVEPMDAPPVNNVGAPITTGLPLQQKEGNMYVLNNDGKTNGLIVSNGRLIVDNGRVGIGEIKPNAKLDVVGSALFSGKVGIGTTDPDTKLDIFGGSIKINDGTQGNGKVLTSNANGKGSWQKCKVEHKFTRLNNSTTTGDEACSKRLGSDWVCVSAGYGVDQYAFCGTNILIYDNPGHTSAGAECIRFVCE